MIDLDARTGAARERLRGKTAIVTGAGSAGAEIGIGKAIALLFAREGAQVAAVDLDPGRADRTCAEIRRLGGNALACAGDVTDGDACARIVAAALAHFGKLDVLVNNVGIAAAGGPLEQLDEAQWQRVMDVNLKSAVLLCKHALPALCLRGGAIVNMASISGIRALASGAAYGPSKAALIMLTREIAAMYGRRGVRANAVAPGHIDSPLAAALFTAPERAARRKVAPLGLQADVWDVALASLFLASDDARFITGACLPVDGGVSELGALAAHRLIED